MRSRRGGNRRHPLPLVAVLVPLILGVVTALSGCAFGGDMGQTEAPGDDVPIVDGAETLENDEADAVRTTALFWQRTFTEQFGRSYNPPRILGGYEGDAGPSCSGQPSVPFNAFYCPSEDFIAWDQQLMVAGYEQIGDAWVYLIIAHEWGHAIQARLERDQVSVQAELQADCLAGATLFGLARLNELTIQPGDTEELAQTLAAVADDFPWTRESDHGDARERTQAFSAGANGEVDACV